MSRQQIGLSLSLLSLLSLSLSLFPLFPQRLSLLLSFPIRDRYAMSRRPTDATRSRIQYCTASLETSSTLSASHPVV
ncbi:hypothetical protein BCV70DRAFT_201916 [Testicularia cyperi]|uniref:Secreted protein n=1 Tax=Testicularia cyperi TaxID=1882483 RepID=A0A317XJU1_9BASI|nr:hypothetical protein BCV70DRAFT_201916 [Testicularia cyperi]